MTKKENFLERRGGEEEDQVRLKRIGEEEDQVRLKRIGGEVLANPQTQKQLN